MGYEKENICEEKDDIYEKWPDIIFRVRLRDEFWENEMGGPELVKILHQCIMTGQVHNDQIKRIIDAAEFASIEELTELIYGFGSSLHREEFVERRLFVCLTEILRRGEFFRQCNM